MATAVAPSIAILSYLYVRDRYEAEPLRLVGLVFLMGMLSSVPVVIVKWSTINWLVNPYLHTILIGAPVEELAKFAITYWLAVRNREFNEEYDGILYAVSASLGFATVENVLKVLHFGLGVAAIRALLSVPGHALFGILMGSTLGRAKFMKETYRRRVLFAQAILIPWITHAVYDMILQSNNLIWFSLLLPFMSYLLWRGLVKIKQAENNSPFKPMKIVDR